VVSDAGGSLSIVLSGHPKLKNDLQRPTMEEIGYRTTVISFEGIAGQQRPYIEWLLTACAAAGTRPGDILEEGAIELLARRLSTPLQIEQYLTRALEDGFRIGERPISAPLIEAILSPQLDELEPRLRRHGYDVRAIAELASARTADIQALLRGELEAARTREITDRLRAVGLPI
jgi:hypothetical protein